MAGVKMAQPTTALPPAPLVLLGVWLTKTLPTFRITSVIACVIWAQKDFIVCNCVFLSPSLFFFQCSSMLEEAFGSDSLVHPLFPSSHSLIPNGYHTDRYVPTSIRLAAENLSALKSRNAAVPQWP